MFRRIKRLKTLRFWRIFQMYHQARRGRDLVRPVFPPAFCAGLLLLTFFFAAACKPQNPKSATPQLRDAQPAIFDVPPRAHPTAAPIPIPTPDVTKKGNGLQTKRWSAATLNPKDSIRLDKAVALFERKKEIYQKLEAMRDGNGVPASVIFCFHYRESDNDFFAHLHEGSPLTHRTRDEPKGRLPAPKNPPYNFLESAEDALYIYEHLDRRDWRHLESALQAAESYNGLGYQKRGLASPYLWSGTRIYTRGKYVADGRYSPTALDAQLGVCAILKRMQQRGIALVFAG